MIHYQNIKTSNFLETSRRRLFDEIASEVHIEYYKIHICEVFFRINCDFSS